MDSRNSSALSEADFRFFAERLQAESGIRLEPSKALMVASRLTRRMRRLGVTSFHEYRQRIEQGADPGETQAMINCLTTNKTDFFRENHHFEFLAKVTQQRWEQMQRRGIAFSLRIWSAGCSTGEEPYSIAITLAESLPERTLQGCEVVASDIDTEVLDFAARGIYSQERLEGLGENRLRFGFLRGRGKFAGRYQVKPALRRLVTFRQINLAEGAWRGTRPFDLIFCRNVMIYFSRQTQQRLVASFEKVLAPQGYLVVGHSESLYGLNDDLEPVGSTVYRRRKDFR